MKLSNYLKNLICPQLCGEFVLEVQAAVLIVFLKLAKPFVRTAAFFAWLWLEIRFTMFQLLFSKQFNQHLFCKVFVFQNLLLLSVRDKGG